jgi:hypothetical protein
MRIPIAPSLTALAIALAAPCVYAQQICQPVADAIRTGTTTGTSAIAVAPAERLTRKEAIDRAQGALKASPRLVQALTALMRFSDGADFYHFGQSALRGVITVEGSAGCQFFTFFVTRPDGSSDLVEPPAVLRDRPEGSMMPCSGAGSLARIGEIGSMPAFIVENGSDQDEQTTVTPWQDGAWKKACTVSAHYSATFTVTDTSCKGVDCPKLGAFARDLVMRFDRDPTSLPPAPTFHPELAGQAALPVFHEVIDHETFAEEAVATPVTFEGRNYLARIGHRAIGWRRFPDYLFGLYREAGDTVEPVAGIVVEKKRDKPVEVIVK